jgi:hypothetical protein
MLMRTPKLYTRSWWRFSTLRRDRFKEVLQKSSDTFDSGYIEAIQKRRSGAWSVAFKVAAIQIPIFVFLVLSLIPVQASVTIFGVSPGASKNLREVLVVASALLGTASAALNHYIDLLGEIVSAYVDRRSKGDKEIAEYLGMGLGTNHWILPNAKYGNAHLGWGFLGFIATLGLLGIIVLLATLLGAGYVHYLVLQDIYLNPSFSNAVSVWIIGFVLTCDSFSILLAFLGGGIFPLRDLTNMLAIAKIGERNPDEASKIYRTIATQHVQRPWIVRLFFRMQMPKNLPPPTN